MTTELSVHHGRLLVGTLRPWSFQYSEAWLDDRGWPLSTSLPLQREPFNALARHWFTNLLPEAGARDRIAQRLRLDPHDSFGLLVALGGECAGALSLDLPEVPPEHSSDDRYRALDEATLETLLEHGPAIAFDEETRLSLAGAQDKLAIRFGPDGEVCVPLGSAPTTHLLKFPSARDSALVENERLCMELASRVGLRTSETSMLELGPGRVLCVARYDRRPSTGEPSVEVRPDGNVRSLSPIERIHQEDFAQALGEPRSRKYEDEGGPNLARIAVNLRRHSLVPAQDLYRLMRWVAFCLVIGNRDNHAKNLSHLLDADTQRWRLSPAYDLVNTTSYKLLNRTLALYIGGERQVERLNTEHWSQQAKAMKVAPRLLLRTVEETADEVEQALEPAFEAVTRELAGDDSRLVQFGRAIKKTINSTRQSLQ